MPHKLFMTRYGLANPSYAINNTNPQHIAPVELHDEVAIVSFVPFKRFKYMSKNYTHCIDHRLCKAATSLIKVRTHVNQLGGRCASQFHSEIRWNCMGRKFHGMQIR